VYIVFSVGGRRLVIGMIPSLTGFNTRLNNIYGNSEPDTELTARILINCARIAPEILDDKGNFQVLLGKWVSDLPGLEE
jgi:hypothetical protein